MIHTNRSGIQLYGINLIAARMIWGLIALLILTMLALSIPVEYQVRLTEGNTLFAESLAALNLSATFYAGFRTSMDLSLILTFFFIAMVIFIRKPSNKIVIYCSIANQTFGALFVPSLYFLEQAQPFWDIPVSIIRALGLITSLIVYFYLIPDGDYRPAWTRLFAYAWIGLVVAWLFFPQLPANLVHMSTWSQTIAMGYFIYIFAYGSGIAAQVYRYRFVSDARQRQQTKWFVFGTILGFIGFILYQLPFVVLPQLFGTPSIYRLYQIFFGIPIYHLLTLAIPICISISITRYRLWDIDHLVNRALIAGTLTAALIFVYAASVVVLTQLLLFITGREQDNIVIALSTLMISLLFFPLKRTVQDVIDRRFYRQRYNTEQTLTALSISLREEVDLEVLVKGLITLVRNTLHPSQISVWLVKQTGSKVDLQYDHENPSSPQTWIDPFDPLFSYFQKNPNILDIRGLNLTSPTLKMLKQADMAIAIPLIGQGQFIGLVNLGSRLSGQDYSVDDYHLLTILASQAAPALRVAQLVRQQQLEIIEREKMDYEMSIARMIQQNFLPKQLPELDHWQIAVHYQPARAVGGDFYDIHCFPDGRLALIIGDVSGHGVPAALMMVNIRSTLRDAARKFSTPGAILREANSNIVPEMPPSMFATCLYAILDPACGRLIFANAGHNLPLQWTQNRIEEPWASGLPLGIMEGVDYEEVQTTIHPNDFMLFFSDGIVEAHNSNREMFGEERIKDILTKGTANAGTVIDELMQVMNSYIGNDAEQEDDITIVNLHSLLTRSG